VERCLYPTRRLGRLCFLIFLWIVLTATSSRSWHTGGAMLSFICALGILLTAVSLIPGATSLKLSSHGFTVRKWFKDESYRWTDIKEFKLITYRYMGFIPIRRSVGFTFSESSSKRNVFGRIVGAIASFDRILPDNYGMKAQHLMALLESTRRQAVGDLANRYAISSDPIEPE
jgi:hypothetical protein